MFDLHCGLNEHEFEGFAAEIRRARLKKFEVDNQILCDFEKSTVHCRLEQLQPQTGRLDVHVQDAVFKCCYFDKTSDNLFVTFSGRRDLKKPVPQFVRWKYHTRLPGSLLCLDDPMFQKHPELAIGWFYGDARTSWLGLAAEVVRKFAALKNIPMRNVFLFSSSAGGYAALHVGCLLEGVNVITVNPQIYPQFWPYAPDFQKITGLDLQASDPFGRNCFHTLLARSTSRFLLITNAASRRDFIGQIFPLCRQTGLRPAYGLVNDKNLWLWTYSTDVPFRPHNSFETNSLLELIIDLAFRIRNGEPVDVPRYAVYADFWNEYYTTLNEKILKNTALIKKCEIFKQRLKAATPTCEKQTKYISGD